MNPTPAAEHSPKRRHSRWLLPFLGLLLTSLAAWQIALFTEQWVETEIRGTGQSRVTLYAGSLRESLEKYRHLPYLLARDLRIGQLLEENLPAIRVNPHLEDFARVSGALLFVLDQQGEAVASSNWREEQSLIGSNFAFRPYFQDAREGRSGSYYAVGVKTGQPGFFLSYPVLETGRLQGIVVAKVDLGMLEKAWRESGETVIVSDASGVVFLSSRPEWKYRSLRPLTEPTAQRLRQAQYLDSPLTTLTTERQAVDGGNILRLESVDYLEQSLQLPEYGWRIHYLSEMRPVRASFRLALASAAGLAVTLILALAFARERRQKHQSRREAREALAIRQANQRLQEEIRQHQQTEQTLRDTQKELVQAGKLAALGRMSAAIAHELNQPVTAIRTFLASSRLLLARQKLDQVDANLDRIDALARRMGGITGQLKTFARKNPGRRDPQDLAAVLERVLSCLAPQLTKSGVEVQLSLPPPGSAVIEGDDLQVEQVLNNLLVNALEAMADSPVRLLSLEMHTSDCQAILLCRDSGPGISDEALESLFEPFATTKPIGFGLGLGLSISYGIVQEMNGTISGENHPEGGAVFTLRLPLAACRPDQPRRSIAP